MLTHSSFKANLIISAEKITNKITINTTAGKSLFYVDVHEHKIKFGLSSTSINLLNVKNNEQCGKQLISAAVGGGNGASE